MDVRRYLRHLATPDWVARRAFPKASLRAIEQAITASERLHQGELRFVVEAGLDFSLLWHRVSARRRALDLFARLRVWDTEHNSGVLIYVQLLDRQVEIVADRGINARVAQDEWEAICRRLELAYRRGDCESGTLAAIGEVTALLRRHFPAGTENPNELPDRPLVL
jgi:TLP18.3/Psb32/MOLO-1 phosphatase superfamily protein